MCQIPMAFFDSAMGILVKLWVEFRRKLCYDIVVSIWAICAHATHFPNEGESIYGKASYHRSGRQGRRG